jgi:hypothetical protein
MPELPAWQPSPPLVGATLATSPGAQEGIRRHDDLEPENRHRYAVALPMQHVQLGPVAADTLPHSMSVAPQDAIGFKLQTRTFLCRTCLSECRVTLGTHGIPTNVCCTTCSNVSYSGAHMPASWKQPDVWGTDTKDSPSVIGSAMTIDRVSTSSTLAPSTMKCQTASLYAPKLDDLNPSSRSCASTPTVSDLPQPRGIATGILGPSPATVIDIPEKIHSAISDQDYLAITLKLMNNHVNPNTIVDSHGALAELIVACTADWTAFPAPTQQASTNEVRTLGLAGPDEPLPSSPSTPRESSSDATSNGLSTITSSAAAPAASVTPTVSQTPAPAFTASLVSTEISMVPAATRTELPVASLHNGCLILSIDALRALGVWDDTWSSDPLLFVDHLRALSSCPTAPDESVEHTTCLKEDSPDDPSNIVLQFQQGTETNLEEAQQTERAESGETRLIPAVNKLPSKCDHTPSFLPRDCKLCLVRVGVKVELKDVHAVSALQPLQSSYASPLQTPTKPQGAGGGQRWYGHSPHDVSKPNLFQDISQSGGHYAAGQVAEQSAGTGLGRCSSPTPRGAHTGEYQEGVDHQEPQTSSRNAALIEDGQGSQGLDTQPDLRSNRSLMTYNPNGRPLRNVFASQATHGASITPTTAPSQAYAFPNWRSLPSWRSGQQHQQQQVEGSVAQGNQDLSPVDHLLPAKSIVTPPFMEPLNPAVAAEAMYINDTVASTLNQVIPARQSRTSQSSAARDNPQTEHQTDQEKTNIEPPRKAAAGAQARPSTPAIHLGRTSQISDIHTNLDRKHPSRSQSCSRLTRHGRS